MATHSSILAWRTPQTEEPGRLQSMGLQSPWGRFILSYHIHRIRRHICFVCTEPSIQHGFWHSGCSLKVSWMNGSPTRIPLLPKRRSPVDFGEGSQWTRAGFLSRTLYLWAYKEERRQPRRSPWSFRWTPCDERSGKQWFSTLAHSQLLGNFQIHLWDLWIWNRCSGESRAQPRWRTRALQRQHGHRSLLSGHPEHRRRGDTILGFLICFLFKIVLLKYN